jgi:sulfur-carrier protein adenylyltransferase/sulfurtransferase
MKQLRIPSSLRRFTSGSAVLTVKGDTINEILKELFAQFPEIQSQLPSEASNMQSVFNLYLDGINIQQLDGMETKTGDNSEIFIIPTFAAGTDDGLPPLVSDEVVRYSRHLHLPEIGVFGQSRLKNSSVLIIGTGGLGSPVSLYLAAAGVGTIGLVDFDIVDISNLQRQVIFSIDDTGESKVEAASEKLKKLNPFINIQKHNIQLNSENALEIIQNYDLVVDGSDNFPTRYLVNDACVILNKPNVYGSIYRFDGQVSVFNFKGGPCYRCLYPEPPPPHLVPSCAEGGVLGVLPGIIGTLQANEVIKILLNIGDTLSSRLLLFDALAMEFSEMKLKKNENCSICGEKPSITKLINYAEFCGVPGSPSKESHQDITVEELQNKLNNGDNITIVDVRETFELQISRLENAVHIPVNEIPSHLNELESADELVILCRTGVRSAQICQFLVNQNFKNVQNVIGGINDWTRKIDPSQRIY